MFGLIRLFKPSKIMIKITEDIYKDKSICSFLELYEKTNIKKHMDEIVKNTEENGFYVYNLKCNKNTYEKLSEFIKNNMLKSRKKEHRILNEKTRLVNIAMDNLIYSPHVIKDVKDDYIYILKRNNKDYVKHERN